MLYKDSVTMSMIQSQITGHLKRQKNVIDKQKVSIEGDRMTQVW